MLGLAISSKCLIPCRASQVLGEGSGKQPQRNAAAEISRASMQLARTEAEALSRPGSEVEILEEQQRRLMQERQARQAARQVAQSTQKPGRKAADARSVGTKHIAKHIARPD